MIVILFVTIGIIIVYLMYPVFLAGIAENMDQKNSKTEGNEGISLILLTYNGIEYLVEKIRFLSKELSKHEKYEFIVIDDSSMDGSRELLQSLKEYYNFTIIQKEVHKGIPHSMNIAVKIASYDYLIFCDQRQQLTVNIIKNIIEPLQQVNIGAVSSYISNIDKINRCSYLRKHENSLKLAESKTGNLIGVYGPMYAVKKCCYSEIPEHIILDDLYLSLKILKKKKISLLKTCCIVDESFSDLYTFRRSKRYMRGLLQLLFEKDLIWSLNTKIKLMLIWHKYLRLLIPLLLFLCYINLAFISFQKEETAYLFGGISLLVLISVLMSCFKLHTAISDVVKTSLYYIVSIGLLMLPNYFFRKNIAKSTKKL